MCHFSASMILWYNMPFADPCPNWAVCSVLYRASQSHLTRPWTYTTAWNFPGGGHGNPLQYSCLENPTDRGAWQAIVHRVAKGQTWLKRLSRPDPNHDTLLHLQKRFLSTEIIILSNPQKNSMRTTLYPSLFMNKICAMAVSSLSVPLATGLPWKTGVIQGLPRRFPDRGSKALLFIFYLHLKTEEYYL